jgi:hypothetical protein
MSYESPYDVIVDLYAMGLDDVVSGERGPTEEEEMILCLLAAELTQGPWLLFPTVIVDWHAAVAVLRDWMDE